MLVIGIGNILMQDDGIGVYLARELQIENQDYLIRYIAGETDVDYCLAEAEEEDYLIILDAVQLGREKGSVFQFELPELSRLDSGFAAHNFHLLHALGIKKGKLIGIEPYHIDFSYGLSRPMKSKYNKIKEKVKGLISIAANVYEQHKNSLE